jgi:hypothetical protein
LNCHIQCFCLENFEIGREKFQNSTEDEADMEEQLATTPAPVVAEAPKPVEVPAAAVEAASKAASPKTADAAAPAAAKKANVAVSVGGKGKIVLGGAKTAAASSAKPVKLSAQQEWEEKQRVLREMEVCIFHLHFQSKVSDGRVFVSPIKCLIESISFHFHSHFPGC